MKVVRRITIIDQTMDALREGISSGRWSGRLPGVRPLSEELGVSRETLRTALRRLETDGTLAKSAPGDARKIIRLTTPEKRDTLRIAILPARRMETESVADQLLILRLMHDLEAAGHACTLVPPPGNTSDPSPAAVARLVAEKEADAWMVYQGSREVLAWFAEQPFATLAIGGANHTLPISSIGFDYEPAIRDATRRLVKLGHRRIVFISPDFSRRPVRSQPIRAFLDELSSAGIPAGEYNSPEWDESPEGLRKLLESLFKLTPPTAIITWDGFEASGVLAFLAERKLTAPGDVSLVALTSDRSIVWQHPGVALANCAQDATPFIRHCVRWADTAAGARPEAKHALLEVEFIPGNTLGPAKK